MINALQLTLAIILLGTVIWLGDMIAGGIDSALQVRVDQHRCGHSAERYGEVESRNGAPRRAGAPPDGDNRPSGFGHGITVPGITVRQVFRNSSAGTLNTLAATDALLALPPGDPGIISDTTIVDSVVNYQERSREVIAEMRDAATRNSEEIRRSVEEAKQRMTRLAQQGAALHLTPHG